MNNQRMMNRPMQGAAEQMATHGRYGDSMLVHMNPVEVQGLASLSPTGELTTNPMTGQPEAFLPFLAPLLGSMLGGSAFTALGGALGTGFLGSTISALGANAALASAVGSGLATTAVTGDLKEGIMSGLTGFGVGKALGAVGDIASGVGAATDASTAATTALGTTTEAAKAASMIPGSAPFEELMKGSAVTADTANALAAQDSLKAIQKTSDSLSNLDRTKALFSGADGTAGAFGSQLTSAGSLIPIAVGEGARGQRKMDQANERALADYEQKKADTLARSTAIRDSAIDQARQDYAYQGYAGGGLVSVNPQEYMRQMNGVHTVGMNGGGPADYNYAGGMPGKGGNFSPASGGLKQRGVRPANVVTADQLAKEAAELSAQGKDPRAGFTGEINYFRKTPEEAGIPVPPDPDQISLPTDPTDPSGGNVNPNDPIYTGDGPISIGGKGGMGYTGVNPSGEPVVNPNLIGGSSGEPEPFNDFVSDGIAGGRRGDGRRRGGNPPVVTPVSEVADAKKAVDMIGGDTPVVPIYSPPLPNVPMPTTVGGKGGIDGSKINIDTLPGNLTGIGDGRATPLNTKNVPQPQPQPMPITMPQPVPQPILQPMPMPSPVPQPAPTPTPRPIMPRQKGPIRQMRFAGGVVNLQAGGIAEIPQQGMSLADPMMQDMGGDFNNPSQSSNPMIQQATPANQAVQTELLSSESGQMGQAEASQVAGEVAQALSQGVTIEQLPPELAQKLMLAIELFGMETVQSMIMNPQQSQASQPTYNFQEGGPVPSSNPNTQLIEQTISAVLGQVSQQEADIIINQFISEFGQEAFEMLRQQALQSVVPNAQTEGEITGQGKGMDDMVNGMIGTEQPVAVSPGEYIIPADVVSGLGDGSTDGGVQELDGMLDRVRQTRTGTMQQPAPMNTGGVLPA
jgi:hypothetical protein